MILGSGGTPFKIQNWISKTIKNLLGVIRDASHPISRNNCHLAGIAKQEVDHKVIYGAPQISHSSSIVLKIFKYRYLAHTVALG
jgi:hypothetical protein